MAAGPQSKVGLQKPKPHQALQFERGDGLEVTRRLGDAPWACQNSVAGILRDRAIGGGVRVDDELKELIWLGEPVPPREEVLGPAW